MATLTLDQDETGSDFLPPRCMRCGRDTEEFKLKNFVWSHPALICLIFLGLPGLILLLILRAVTAKRMTVDVPICPRHRLHWEIGTALVAFFLIFDVALVITFAVAHDEIDRKLGGAAFGGMLLFLLASIPVMIVISARKVRPTKIDSDIIQLAGVDAGFADEIRQKQRAEREAERARRNAYRNDGPFFDGDSPA
jgi:hypothetical protein